VESAKSKFSRDRRFPGLGIKDCRRVGIQVKRERARVSLERWRSESVLDNFPLLSSQLPTFTYLFPVPCSLFFVSSSLFFIVPLFSLLIY
jgi:hypothetical protein